MNVMSWLILYLIVRMWIALKIEAFKRFCNKIKEKLKWLLQKLTAGRSKAWRSASSTP